MILRRAVSCRDNPSTTPPSTVVFTAMPSGDFSDLPNPFAPEPTKRKSIRVHGAVMRPLLTSMKLLALVTVVFTLFIVVTSHGPDWLARRLASDFDTLDVAAKQARLEQFAELGFAGIQPLTIALADPEIEVAESAHQVIGRLQNQWTADTKEHSDACKKKLAECLAQVDQHLSGQRRNWVADLTGQASTIDLRDEESAERQNDQVVIANTIPAAAVLMKPQIAVHPDYQPQPMPQLPISDLPQQPRSQLTQQPMPQLPMPELMLQGDEDNQWPPARIAQVGFVAQEEAAFETSYSVGSIEQEAIQPRAYGQQLQQAAYDESIQHRNVREPLQQSPPQPQAQIPIDPPLDHYVGQLESADTQSVIALLGSDDQSLHPIAESELINRGFDELQLRLARMIATGDVRQRIDLIGHLVSSESIDPRPWLLLMLDDEDRSVKTEAVFALARTLDPDVRTALRLHLAAEPDQAVALQIRDVLNLR